MCRSRGRPGPWPAAAALLFVALAPAQDAAQEERAWVSYQREQRVEDLLGFCMLDYDLEVEYEPGQIDGTVTVLPGRRIPTDELWATAHRALATEGLTTVQMPESKALRVVPIEDATGMARIEEDLATAQAGFLKALVPLAQAKPEEVAVAARLVMTPAGTVAELREARTLVLSDLAPNVRQAVRLAETLDSIDATARIEEVEVRNTSPVTLAAWLGQLEQTATQVTGEARAGKLVANPSSGTILIVAPEGEVARWRERVRRFDRAERAYTEHYTPRRFGLAETADLIERAVYAEGADDPSGAWDLVTDQLTGTLIVTAPRSKHAEIEELLARLESQAYGDRRPMRAFPIRNRQVAELVDLLQSLLDAGALDAPGPDVELDVDRAQGATAPLPERRRRSVLDDPSGVTIAADEPTNRIVAMGEARLLDQLEVLIETLDVRHSQVLVEAIVLSLSDTDTFDLGVELRRVGTSGGTLFELASLFGLSSVTAGSTAIPAATGTGFSGVLLDPRDFSAVVRALETLNEGRSLTIPKVLVNNNEDAVLESVAQSPFASTNASDTVATTSFGGTLDAGTSITVKPQIAEGDHLVLDYTVSLSSFTGDSADPNLPPPRQENRLESIVTIPDGHCVVVGGLEVESETEAESRVPWLGRVPLVGQLFSSQSESTTKTRFYVFLRANVLRHESFADLKYRSRNAMEEAGLDDGRPRLQPRVIR